MKTKVILCIAAAVAMSVACSKEETQNVVSSGKCSFYAVVEPQADESKAKLNSGITGLEWTKDDEVKIYGSTKNAVFKAASGGTSTTLNGDSVDDTAPYAAFYPAGIVSNYVNTSNPTFTVTFPATQTYVEGNIADGAYPMMGYIASGTDKNFAFKNVGGLLCIKVKAAYDDIKVQSIKLTAETPISGPATVSYLNDTTKVTMTGAEEANKSITLDCSKANATTGVAINSSDYTPFYVVVPSGSYKNLKVTITASIKGNIYTYTGEQVLTNPNTVTLPRSTKSTFQMTAAKIVFDLSKANGENETANCYLIEKPGVYKFPVTKKGNCKQPDGTTAEDISGVDSAEQIWADGSFATVPATIGSIADGYLTFSTPTTLGKGNFGVAIKNTENEILWSWHIWANGYVNNVTSIGSSSYTFLDRNLGAPDSTYNSTSGNGFFYQWGRKDPFQQTTGSLTAGSTPWSYQSTTSTTIAGAIANPTVAYRDATSGSWCTDDFVTLWCVGATTAVPTNTDVVKTMYDPCPPGYHVPSWKAFKYIAGSGATINKKDDKFEDWTLNGINWQGAGFRFFNGITKINNQGSSNYSFHGWSAFAVSATTAWDFHGSNAGKASPFYSYGWHLGAIIRPEKN